MKIREQATHNGRGPSQERMEQMQVFNARIAGLGTSRLSMRAPSVMDRLLELGSIRCGGRSQDFAKSKS